MTLIDKAEALEPCPFCTEGKSVSTYFDHEQGDKWGYASCDACGARGPEVRTNYDRDDNAPWRVEALAAWNRRAALPARGVGVRPLVWEGDEEKRHDLIARPDPFHTYTVRPLGDARFDVVLNHELGSLWFRQRKGEIWPDYASAKAAAQADYEARILAALEPTDAAQAREAAARLLLDMLHMRNGAHEGVTKDDAQAMWEAASTRGGYAAVDAFLRSIIKESRT